MPRALLLVGGAALIAAIVSIAVGEGGPQAQDVGGVNEVQRLFGGIAQDGALLGSEDAETTVTVFNDLQCEPLRRRTRSRSIDPLVEDYARTERARFEFRHFSLAPERHDAGGDRRRGRRRAGAPVAVPRHVRAQPGARRAAATSTS